MAKSSAARGRFDSLLEIFFYKQTNNLKSFNCAEIIAILVCKQISFNSFKNEITYKLCANKWLMLDFNCYIAILETI